MNGLHYISRSSSALPLQSFHAHSRNPSYTITSLAVSSSTSSTEMENADAEEEKSEIYSHNMTEAMGAVLTYKHELGMNYNFIRPDLIVGSCLQAPYDVDKLRSIGVKTIFCLQQDSDLEYFGVDITGIREYADTYDDFQHLRAEIRDFDAFDLRMRLPAVVSKLHKAISRNGGVTYIHCTAGLGRAPAVALAHMFWFDGYKLSDGHSLLLSKRLCCPKLDAIKSATADIRMPLKYDNEQCLWILQRKMLEGRYEYKYIIDGEWTCNSYELVTPANKDGHVNNYVEVFDSDPNSITAALWKRLMSDDPYLTENEQLKIRQFLEACTED